MGWFFGLLASPVFGPVKGLHWLAKTVAEQSNRERFDEAGARTQLLELQARYDLGEVSEEDYEQQEAALLDQLNAIREARAGPVP